MNKLTNFVLNHSIGFATLLFVIALVFMIEIINEKNNMRYKLEEARQIYWVLENNK